MKECAGKGSVQSFYGGYTSGYHVFMTLHSTGHKEQGRMGTNRAGQKQRKATVRLPWQQHYF